MRTGRDMSIANFIINMETKCEEKIIFVERKDICASAVEKKYAVSMDRDANKCHYASSLSRNE